MAKDKMDNTKKVLNKAKDTTKKAMGKTKETAKTALKATKDKFNDLRQNSIFNEILAKGEFVVNGEYRTVLALIANLLLIALFLMSMGELILALVTYLIVQRYSHLLTEFGITQYLIFSFLALLVFDIFFLWALTSYQEVEERHDVPGIKRRHICIKISYYLTFALLVLMIILHVKISRQFGGLPDELKTRISKLMTSYNSSRDDKGTMDQLQWSYQCCGGSDHTDWFKSGDRPNVVPFSCCTKSCCKGREKCHFANTTIDNLASINSGGCIDPIKYGFEGLRKGVQWYRLTEFAIVFCYTVLIDIIERSLHSQYDLGTIVPVSGFPLLYVLLATITWIVLLVFFFKSLA